MLSKKFWLDAGERAAKTFAQTLLAMLSVATVFSDVDWQLTLSAAGLSALVSLVSSVASAGSGDKDSASLLK